jgi:hypothetical protein
MRPHLGKPHAEVMRRRGLSAQRAQWRWASAPLAWWRSGAGRARGMAAQRPGIMASARAGSHAEAARRCWVSALPVTVVRWRGGPEGWT